MISVSFATAFSNNSVNGKDIDAQFNLNDDSLNWEISARGLTGNEQVNISFSDIFLNSGDTTSVTISATGLDSGNTHSIEWAYCYDSASGYGGVIGGNGGLCSSTQADDSGSISVASGSTSHSESIVVTGPSNNNGTYKLTANLVISSVSIDTEIVQFVVGHAGRVSEEIDTQEDAYLTGQIVDLDGLFTDLSEYPKANYTFSTELIDSSSTVVDSDSYSFQPGSRYHYPSAALDTTGLSTGTHSVEWKLVNDDLGLTVNSSVITIDIYAVTLTDMEGLSLDFHDSFINPNDATTVDIDVSDLSGSGTTPTIEWAYCYDSASGYGGVIGGNGGLCSSTQADDSGSISVASGSTSHSESIVVTGPSNNNGTYKLTANLVISSVSIDTEIVQFVVGHAGRVSEEIDTQEDAYLTGQIVDLDGLFTDLSEYPKANYTFSTELIDSSSTVVDSDSYSFQPGSRYHYPSAALDTTGLSTGTHSVEWKLVNDDLGLTVNSSVITIDIYAVTLTGNEALSVQFTNSQYLFANPGEAVNFMLEVSSLSGSGTPPTIEWAYCYDSASGYGGVIGGNGGPCSSSEADGLGTESIPSGDTSLQVLLAEDAPLGRNGTYKFIASLEFHGISIDEQLIQFVVGHAGSVEEDINISTYQYIRGQSISLTQGHFTDLSEYPKSNYTFDVNLIDSSSNVVHSVSDSFQPGSRYYFPSTNLNTSYFDAGTYSLDWKLRNVDLGRPDAKIVEHGILLDIEIMCSNGATNDADCDGVDDSIDLCSSTLPDQTVDSDGCPDEDGDGVIDPDDNCPNTPAGESVDSDGCSLTQLDSDNDGVADYLDQCPNTVAGATVDMFGCELDSDGDGVKDSADQCPNEDATGFDTDGDGCIDDSDNDGIADSLDQCPNEDATGFDTNGDGCIDDTDLDGIVDSIDLCPNEDATGFDANNDGCLDDTDMDGLTDDVDVCPNEDATGFDTDGDGCIDDSDNDGVKDNVDQCPNEDATGFDTDGDGCIDDGDGDGVKDNIDQCLNTPAGAVVSPNGCNDAPVCDLTYDDGTNTLTVQRDMPTVHGQVTDVDVTLPSGTYTFVLICTDPESQPITIDVSFDGGPVSTFSANPVSATVPVPIVDGVSLTKQLEYTWSDGVNSGNVVVNIEVSGDDTASGGGFVPGFTSLLTVLSMIGACLLLRRW